MPETYADIEVNVITDVISKLTDAMVHNPDQTGEFLLKLKDGRVIDTKGWDGWEWTHGIGLYGLWQHYSLTMNQKSLKIFEEWYEDKMIKNFPTTKNINTMAVFLPLMCYVDSLDPHSEKARRFLPHIESWAEWVLDGLPRTEHQGFQHMTYANDHDNELWDDTLMMTVMPLAKIGKSLNKPHYVQEAIRQFLLHIKYLGDTKTGLFFHGWKFTSPSTGHNFAEALWARGNSWLTIVLPEFIELLDLDESDPVRQFLLQTLEAQVEALARTQDPNNGLWHTLLDRPTSYTESSASAGFAFGILKSIRKRYISAEKYGPVAIKAIKGLLTQVDDKGRLQNTSFGTGVGDTKEFYETIRLTTMPYGQAMAIMAFTEFLKLYI